MSKPFEATFANLRHGRASMEAADELDRIVKSVCDTGKAAKLVIELTVKPNTKNHGFVEAVIITDKITAKIPPIPGESVMFVNSKMELSTQNERQGDLFPEIQRPSRPMVSIDDVDDEGVITQVAGVATPAN